MIECCRGTYQTEEEAAVTAGSDDAHDGGEHSDATRRHHDVERDVEELRVERLLIIAQVRVHQDVDTNAKQGAADQLQLDDRYKYSGHRRIHGEDKGAQESSLISIHFYTCLSFCSPRGWEEYLSGRDPPGQRPLWTETPLDRDPRDRDPLGQRPPWTETPPWTEPPPYGNELAVRILLECILVFPFYFLILVQFSEKN